MSFSYGKSVICPRIETIQDLDDQSNVITYNYKDSEDHIEQLRAKIIDAVKIKRTSPKKIKKWRESF